VLVNAHSLDTTESGHGGPGGLGSDAKPMTPDEVKAVDAKEKTLRFNVEKYYIHPLYVKQ